MNTRTQEIQPPRQKQPLISCTYNEIIRKLTNGLDVILRALAKLLIISRRHTPSEFIHLNLATKCINFFKNQNQTKKSYYSYPKDNQWLIVMVLCLFMKQTYISELRQHIQPSVRLSSKSINENKNRWLRENAALTLSLPNLPKKYQAPTSAPLFLLSFLIP